MRRAADEAVAGVNVNTVTRLMAMPLASARPRSAPMRYCMATSARKPMVTVHPLEKIATEDLQSASTMSPSALLVDPRSSA